VNSWRGLLQFAPARDIPSDVLRGEAASSAARPFDTLGQPPAMDPSWSPGPRSARHELRVHGASLIAQIYSILGFIYSTSIHADVTLISLQSPLAGRSCFGRLAAREHFILWPAQRDPHSSAALLVECAELAESHCTMQRWPPGDSAWLEHEPDPPVCESGNDRPPSWAPSLSSLFRRRPRASGR
jgi:hypothetical protein